MKVTDHTGNEVDVRYYYFGRGLWERHHGISTAGAIVNGDDKTVKVAFAFCSPLDNFRRFNGEPLRRKLRDNGGHLVYNDAGDLQYEELSQNGGIDIVNARLGVGIMDGINEQHYSGPYTGSIIGGVIDVFNKVVPVEDKPQLWRRRALLLAPRHAIARDGAWTRKELSDLNTMNRKADFQAGFVYVG